MAAENGGNSGDGRLTTWKEIASFLGRDERTVKRWEGSRGLPVRRVPGQGRPVVFAYAHELQGWLDGSGETAQATETIEAVTPRVDARRRLWLAAAGLLVLAVSAAVIWRLNLSHDHASAPHDPVALEEYRSGLHAWQTRTPSGIARAIADFNAAIKRDPNYAEAYSGLADAYNLAREFGTMPASNAYARAHAAALRAVQLDPSLSGAHAALAFTTFYWLRNVVAARREFARAIELDPNNATAHHWFATFLMTTGDFPAALLQINRAAELDSESTAILADKALILFYTGDLAHSVQLLKQIESDQPTFASPHLYLAAAYLSMHDDAAFLHELRVLGEARHDPDMILLADNAAQGLASAGRTGMLQSIAQKRKEFFAHGKASAYSVAESLALLHDETGSLQWLSASVSRHELDTIAVKIDPAFEGLRNTVGFRRLQSRAGL